MRRVALAAIAASVVSAVAAPAPALAANPDCRIYGPEYVAEVVDCAIYIYMTAIG